MPADGDALLHMRGITKRFPGVTALDSVDFEVRRGEVHALVGGNGAGKSTLIKVLTGVVSADAGSLTLDGVTIHPRSPADAQRQGISTIYQEVNLIPTLSVAENLVLGRAPRGWFGLRWRKARGVAEQALAELGVRVDVRAALGSLPVGVQQAVAIARALLGAARLVVMDEPTSSLDRHELDRFFSVVAGLRARGVGVVFITHFLDEVFRISDRITVLRNGRRVGTFDRSKVSRAELVGHMLGRELAAVESGPRRSDAEITAAPIVLAARGIARRRALAPTDVDVRAGRVTGLAGLLGSGRTELARLLTGADRADAGTLQVDARPLRPRWPRQAIRAGVAMTPEDRRADGLIPDLSVRDNICLVVQRSLRRWGLRRRGAEHVEARRWMERLGVAGAALDTPVRNLSGGNQQKVILARWLACRPRVLILDEPTRGIDVGAKADVEQIVRSLCEEGMGVVFISAELDEVARLADEVLVLRDRRPVATLRGAEVTEARILSAIAAEGARE